VQSERKKFKKTQFTQQVSKQETNKNKTKLFLSHGVGLLGDETTLCIVFGFKSPTNKVNLFLVI
jgi:hypothetical protein